MTTRTIKLKLLTQNNLVSVVTGVRTLAEFKKTPEVLALNIDWESTKLIDRESKAIFDLDEAVMPAINAIMFVTPTKTKGGIDYSLMSYSDLRKQCVIDEVSVRATPSKAEMIIALTAKTAFDNDEEVDGEVSINIKFKVSNSPKFIEVNRLIELTTLDDLENEAQELCR